MHLHYSAVIVETFHTNMRLFLFICRTQYGFPIYLLVENDMADTIQQISFQIPIDMAHVYLRFSVS